MVYLRLNSKQDKKNQPKRKMFLWVLSVHIFIICFILLIFTIKGCTSKKPNMIRVNLVSSMPQAVKSAPPSPAKRPVKQPKKTTKKAAPKKKVVPKKTVPKKKWKALDPSQIRKSQSKVIKKTAPPKKTVKPIKASDIAGNIRKNVKKIKFKNSYTASRSVLNYYDEVSQYLYGRWEQPARMGNGAPVVQVRVSVASNGRILRSSIIKKSGSAVMDASVARLLSSLSALPAPPDGAMEFDIYLELTD